MKPTIICVDDQREVLAAIARDLGPLDGPFDLVTCESSRETWLELEACDDRGGLVAVVISDHVMPGGSGVELLSRLAADPRFARTRKVLLTGLATHADTIDAINRAAIDRYIAKPWDPLQLVNTVRRLATQAILESGLEPADFSGGVLDADVVLASGRRGGDS